VQSPPPSLDQQFYRDAHLFVHLRHQVVILDSEAVSLRPIEYRLLTLLVKHAGEVVPRATILKQIWGDPPDIPDRGRIRTSAGCGKN
jgi:two-component system KDP operon response regulator KdpE